MPYYRRRKAKRPSELRFVRGFLVSILAVAVDWAIQHFASVFCDAFQHGRGCSELPLILIAGPLVVALGGVLASAYMYYRDFHCGDYWRDLADAGYL